LKRELRNSALAESDLAAQADKYMDELAAGIEQLGDNPEMGERCDYVREGYRVLLINRHAVYYTVAYDWISVVRVLHGEMDPGRHL
jgi:toxin ParE1/3/4